VERKDNYRVFFFYFPRCIEIFKNFFISNTLIVPFFFFFFFFLQFSTSGWSPGMLPSASPGEILLTFRRKILLPSSELRNHSPCFFTTWYLIKYNNNFKDRLCGLVVRVLDYRCRDPGFDSWALQKKGVGLERGPLSLVSTTEVLLSRKPRIRP
jgi:hypothetical protein